MSGKRPLALVTGASAGIGAAFARRLAADGFDLVLVARRRRLLDELADELRARCGAASEVLAADLAEEAALKAVEERVAGATELSLLVNNAGIGARGLFFETGAEVHERMHRLHVLAALRLTHAALAGMVRRGEGAVINVSSVAAFGQSPGNAGYCATKAWMNSFTEGLGLELRRAGSPVRVQALCPGYTRTGFHEAMGSGRDQAPAGWWMDPEDVVDASLRGLARNRLFVVPGLRYKAAVLAMRLTPRFLLAAAAVRLRRPGSRGSAAG